jgi:ACS family glucarate transporter-like MFS transporter
MQATKPTHVRYLILLMLFLVTTINYADRATIAIAGSSLQKTSASTRSPSAISFCIRLGLRGRANPRRLAARPFRLEKVYALSIFTWSLFTVLQGYVGEFGMSTAVVALFMLRFMVGLAEAPSFPVTRASWRPGSRPLNAARPRRSSTRRNTSPRCCSRR